jgi:hypothetical protein
MQPEKSTMTGKELGKQEAFVNNEDTCLGLTKREYFAGLAPQGLLANPDPAMAHQLCEFRAMAAVQLADALLDELARGGE